MMERLSAIPDFRPLWRAARGGFHGGRASLGARAVWALSLPGKVAPVSAARAIRDTVYAILQEEEIL